jgi:cytochrome c-type biogenesis protein CcmH
MADTATRTASPARPRRSSPRQGLLRLVVVLAVALAIGSGIGSTHGAPHQRIVALETQIRCPSCADLSVAESTSSAAIAVRREITQLVVAGESDDQIRSALVAQYGNTILLRPPDSGITSLVWIIPAVAGAAAFVALGIFFWRRSREFEALKGEALKDEALKDEAP